MARFTARSPRPDWLTYRPNRRCAADGCAKLAADRNMHCHTHRERITRYGTPDGRRIPARTLAPYLKIADDLLEVNADRASTRAALEWLKLLITQPQSPLLNAATAHLRAGRVTPESALRRLLAIWLLHARMPATLDDGPALTFQLGRALLLIARRPSAGRTGAGRSYGSPYKKRTVRALGELLRKCLCVYFQRLIEAHDAQRDREADLLEIMRGEVPEADGQATAGARRNG